MKVTLNGHDQEVPDGHTLLDLLRRLDLKPELVAVELNRAIVGRPAFAETRLADGDSLEIVHFVGGG